MNISENFFVQIFKNKQFKPNRIKNEPPNAIINEQDDHTERGWEKIINQGDFGKQYFGYCKAKDKKNYIQMLSN